MLAAGADGLRNILRLGGRQHEYDVPGRLFQSLQQRVEGCVGDLVGFVQDINLEAVARGTVARSLAQFTDFVNATVGGGVNLDHVNRVAGTDFSTGFADSAGLWDWMILGTAVQGHRQDAGNGCLPDAAVAAENVAVGRPSLLDGILQSARNMFLSDDFGELLRTVLARQNLIAHGREVSIIRDGRSLR